MTKTVRLKFKNSEGKKFTISVNHANPALVEEGGAETAQEVVDTLMEKQPQNRVMAECTGVEVVDRNVVTII